MVSKSSNSQSSLIEATRGRAKFSGHGGALGAAGRREKSFDTDNAEELRAPGQSIAISPGAGGFADEILIGVEWDPVVQIRKKFFGLFEQKKVTHVDLDIGCLYELQDGRRGAIQAFGEKWGAYDEAPFISLSGDERTGHADGHDEFLHVNGARWNEIKRILVYLYIYKGVPHWAKVNPRVVVDVPGEKDLYVSLSVDQECLHLCAIGGLENVRGGIRLTNYTEYFPGHEEMDRAFGFGLEWGEGKKS